MCKLFRSNAACHYCDACEFQGYGLGLHGNAMLIVMERPSAVSLTYSSFKLLKKEVYLNKILKSQFILAEDTFLDATVPLKSTEKSLPSRSV